jgi:hypothetical protein
LSPFNCRSSSEPSSSVCAIACCVEPAAPLYNTCRASDTLSGDRAMLPPLAPGIRVFSSVRPRPLSAATIAGPTGVPAARA